ncbi:MAG: hypothetical protein P4L33_01145 [Capsulimonadaceae bacterium]|nr:hypothetical protein [Capsulimonadaceae bacterium]
MSTEYLMRPGDRFEAIECGCAFIVESGPISAALASQPPRCCCGHAMHRVGSSYTREAKLPPEKAAADRLAQRLEGSI